MVNSFYKTEFAKIKYPLQIVQHMYICGPHCVHICECMLSVFAGFEIIFDSFAHVFLCFLRALSLSLSLCISPASQQLLLDFALRSPLSSHL